MRTLIKIIAGLLLVVVAVVVVLAFIIDPNDYKDEIRTRAEAALGRSVDIGGDIDLRLGLTTDLAIDDVRLANASWASEPQMVTVDDFAVEVRVLPLLRGSLDIKGLQLRGARILLERNEAGEANWEFTADETGPDERTTPGGDGGGELSLPVLQEVTVEDVTLVFRDAAARQEIDVVLDEVRLSGDGPNSPLQLALAGTYNELPFSAGGELGAPATLARNSPYPIDIRAEALGLTVEVDGSIAEPLAAAGLNLRLDVDGSNLSGLAALAGDGLPSGGPLSFSTNLRGDPTRLELADLAFAFGATELTGNLTLSSAGARPQLAGDLQSPRIDLAALMPEAEPDGSGTRDGTGQSSGETGGRRLPDTPLPLEGFRAADVDLAVDVAELITPSLTLRDTRLGVRLDNGVLTVDPLRTTAANSALTGLLRLDAAGYDAALDVSLEGPDLDLGALVQELTGQDIIRGKAALDTSLRGSGASVAAIAGSLDGHSRLVMEEGMARTESFDLIVGGLTGVVSTVFSGQDEFTVVNCLATDLEFDNGVSTTLALIDTDLIVVSATGDIDLGAETLDLRVTPESKSPTLSLAVPINVGGTFADPSFAPDAVGTARIVGGLLGTAVFPPAALLALSDMGAADNSCVRTAGETDAAPAQEQQAPATLTPESVEDAVKSLGEGIRGLFDR